MNTETDVKTEERIPAWARRLPPWLIEILGWVEVIAVALIIAFTVNTFLIANSRVPTGSMETTIMSGDRVIGSRLAYLGRDPARGDVVIFRFGWICEHCKKAMGENPAPEVCPRCGKEIEAPKTLYYVKRVIGLPGDTVEIVREGSVSQDEVPSVELKSAPSKDARLAAAAVYVNGEKLTEDYLHEPMLYTGDMSFEVPEGSFFFLGDNRNQSLDARYWNDHYIEKEQIVAKVYFRYFPVPKIIK